MIKRFVSLVAAIITVLAVAVGVYMVMNIIDDPAKKPVAFINEVVNGKPAMPVVGPQTKLTQENEYICGDVEVYYIGPATSEVLNLDFDRLTMKYPEQSGWKIKMPDHREVTITRSIDALCGMHREYRHLGLYNDKLAVYQGPLGYDGVLLRLERNIKIEMLPELFQDNLKLAERYNELSDDEKIKLQKSLEFANENSLNALLENFDELSGQ